MGGWRRIFDLLSEQPELASVAANAKLRPYIEEMVPHPILGLFSARFQCSSGARTFTALVSMSSLKFSRR